MTYVRGLDLLRTFLCSVREHQLNASTMSYSPPTVNLPIPADKIDGQTMTFRPVRDGIDSEVSGVIQVVERANGFNVNDQDASLFFDQRPGDRIDLRLIEPINVRLRWILSDDVRGVDVKSVRPFDHLNYA